MKILLSTYLMFFIVNASADIEKGKRLYMANCLQCHNKDPNLKGSMGPELVDTPLDVMTIKVATGRYPEKFPAGYVPKRKTKVMRPFPQLKADAPDIWGYVQSFKKK